MAYILLKKFLLMKFQCDKSTNSIQEKTITGPLVSSGNQHFRPIEKNKTLIYLKKNLSYTTKLNLTSTLMTKQFRGTQGKLWKAALVT